MRHFIAAGLNPVWKIEKLEISINCAKYSNRADVIFGFAKFGTVGIEQKPEFFIHWLTTTRCFFMWIAAVLNPSLSVSYLSLR